ncbi:BlaI/MecI/CopY family transcriptional regulator [Dyadobacter sp. CY261]|uniref:BlaI/MecI/CopY family transcriptional regulator n=1 Tax=Dyadobacter sp. CY261 TaxID=2907203 RepID=UPI001F3BBDF7|nr:BlaI/MecI/CopY family transcriptional regulator [Dyadobacter sp. CY261]MCF0070775.1 BlaI/MecI/CopY family transcriptional regulator [Dyadobacter sp. CY261]
MQLSKTEEQLMEYLWQKEKVFLKDLIECFPDPKPATTTIATLLKRMQDKGFVAYKLYGNSREYYPLIRKSQYFSKQVNGIIKTFFNDSASQFGSFFARETSLTAQELEALRDIIDEEIKRKQND